MSSTDTLDAAPAPTAHPPGFLDLPREVQKEIFSHCSQGDLICSSLVSKEFRELAAAQLYRNFHIVFPDEDDPSYESPIDGLAGGLDTFVTSDYDYAKHLRDLSLDTLSAGDKAETAYKAYLYSVSCGKFLNTLILLTLRKAKSLEAFRCVFCNYSSSTFLSLTMHYLAGGISASSSAAQSTKRSTSSGRSGFYI